MKFSASMLKTFQECALQAKFSYLDQRPQQTGSAALFGSAVHEAIDMYHNGYTEEECVSYFIDFMNNNEPDYWNRRATLSGYLDQGTTMIREYIKSRQWSDTEVIASEFRFMVDIGEHQFSGIIDSLMLPNDHSALYIVDNKTGKRPILDALYLNIQFCADEETEILSRRGWLRFDEIKAGEEVLTYNQELKISEWQPALEIHTFEAKEQELVSFEGKAHSSLTTANHRWPVEHLVHSEKGNRWEDRIVLSESLTSSDRIICAAPTSNIPDEATIDDEIVKMVAWFWTEGHIVKGGSISIAQSANIYPEQEQEIRDTLFKLYGQPRTSLRNGKQPLPYPTWRESLDSDVTRFYLNRIASLEILSHFSNLEEKVISYEFLHALTKEQLQLFYDISMKADGSTSKADSWVISQSSKARLDIFQIVCSLLGIRTSLRKRTIGGQGKYKGRIFWELSIKSKDPRFVPSPRTRSIKTYTGIVWCPRTDNQTWFARREGHVYYTGNTGYHWASYQKEFWCGYPGQEDKYSGFENGEELWEYFKDIPREGYWLDLKKMEYIYVGPRGPLDFARMYRLMEQVSRAIELDACIPTIDESTCTWCPYQDVCPVYHPQTLVGDELDV